MKRSHGAAPQVPLAAMPPSHTRPRYSNLQPGAPAARKPFEIKNVETAEDEDTVAEVFIYSEIGDSWWGDSISATGFVKQLMELDVDQIDVHINSPGGDIFDGVAIYNALLRNKANIVVYVDGLAASAASFIAQAGDEVIMTRASTMMIHDGWGFAMGNAADMREMADVLDKLSNNIASIYAARAGGSVEEWRDVMVAEAWYNAEEAVAAGLADRVDGKGEKAENRWDLSVFNFAGRDAAPSPDLIRQSVALNRATKESPVGKPTNHDDTTPGEGQSDPLVTDPEGTVAPDAETQPDADEQEAATAAPDAPAAPDTTTLPTPTPTNRAGAFTVLVNGLPTSDPSAVQAHINTLEGFATESKASARKAFVNKLAEDGKIGAPQAASFETLVATLDDEQYGVWQAAWETAPQLPLFARHGAQNGGGPESADAARSNEIEVLQGIVNHHRQSGKSEADLQKMESYQKLQKLLGESEQS